MGCIQQPNASGKLLHLTHGLHRLPTPAPKSAQTTARRNLVWPALPTYLLGLITCRCITHLGYSVQGDYGWLARVSCVPLAGNAGTITCCQLLWPAVPYVPPTCTSFVLLTGNCGNNRMLSPLMASCPLRTPDFYQLRPLLTGECLLAGNGLLASIACILLAKRSARDYGHHHLVACRAQSILGFWQRVLR
jgi:hypothetical protein